MHTLRRLSLFITLLVISGGALADVLQHCATDLCSEAGKAFNYEKIYQTSFEFAQKTDYRRKRFRDHYVKYFENYFTLADKLLRHKFARLKYLIDHKPVVSPDFQRLHDLFELLSFWNNLSFSPEPAAISGRKVDVDVSRSHLSALKKAQQDWILALAQSLLKNPSFVHLINTFNEPIAEYFKDYYGGLPLERSLETDAGTLRRALSEQNSAINILASQWPELSLVLGSSVFQKAELGQKLDAAELEQYHQIKNLLLFAIVVTGQVEWTNNPEPFSDFLKRNKISEVIAVAQSTLSNEVTIKRQQKNVLGSCATNYYAQLWALPTKVEIEVGTKNFAESKALITTKGLNGFSLPDRLVIERELDRTSLNLPMLKDLFPKYFLMRLKQLDEQVAMELQSYMTLEKDGKDEQALMLMTRIPSSIRFESNYSKAKILCDEIKPQELTDGTQTSTGGILVSWMGFRLPDQGKRIFLHELGHFVSSILRSEKISEEGRVHFNKILSCLKAKHLQDGQAVDYSEEDWADLVATVAANDSMRNHGCFLMQQENDLWSNLSVINPNPIDSHSSPFFRALHMEYLQRGRLPESCEQSLNTSKQNRNFSSCLD